MIWYLLSAVRGTTRPPELLPTHPLRRVFARHGTLAARFPLHAILISVTIAAVLIYPFPFLYTNNFTNGASNLPHHVWTAAQPFHDQTTSTTADVVMRSIWVHGSYMQALESHVLHEALLLQDVFLGPMIDFSPRRSRPPKGDDDAPLPVMAVMDTDYRDRLHAINGVSDSSWFFHSPLQYWNSSAARIRADADILDTVNSRAKQATSVNVTLRHSIVFAGKLFEDHRLMAADTLVITLVHMLNSPMGAYWERQTARLAALGSPAWRMYPAAGEAPASTLYEFRFQPLSWQDDVVLAAAYLLTALYFGVNLSRIRAVKSRLGLSIAVAAQLAISIMSSFTVCAILEIDLSKIPRLVYPIVILACGLEDMFRLVNAVLGTPNDQPPSLRMAEALGRTGHIALAAVLQNVAILYFMSGVVSAGISAFCTFTALALAFDFFYLMTFFVAVVSVELRRTELSDSLNKVAERTRAKVATMPTWLDTLMDGNMPRSTRIAGTAVMIGSVVIAQRHFFDDVGHLSALRRLFAGGERAQKLSSTLTVDINQARTPTAWLRLQDHETAREVINIIKPQAHSFVARVYEPLIFVLAGSDRRRTASGVRRFLPAAYDFVKHQLTTFALTVSIFVAGVCLLMNYLLHDRIVEEELEPSDDPVLEVRHYPLDHSLDIHRMAYAHNMLATAALDRSLRVWDMSTCKSYALPPLPEVPHRARVLALALDDDAARLAVLSSDGSLLVWRLQPRTWQAPVRIQSTVCQPLRLAYTAAGKDARRRLLLITRDGFMTVLDYDGYQQPVNLSSWPLIDAHIAGAARGQALIRVVTVNQAGEVLLVSQDESQWITTLLYASAQGVGLVQRAYPLLEYGLILLIRERSVDVLDVASKSTLHSISTPQMQIDSLHCHVSARPHHLDELQSLTLVYSEDPSQRCIVRTLTLHDGSSEQHAHRSHQAHQEHHAWRDGSDSTHEISTSTHWVCLDTGQIIGVRKNRPSGTWSASASHSFDSHHLPNTSIDSSTSESVHDWEVWTTTVCDGDTITTQSLHDGHDGHDDLLTNRPGPLLPCGRRRVAVAIGAGVKIIAIGGRTRIVDAALADEEREMSREHGHHRHHGNHHGTHHGASSLRGPGGPRGMQVSVVGSAERQRRRREKEKEKEKEREKERESSRVKGE